MSIEAEHLRARMVELRKLAEDIERTPLLSLDRHAGPETWSSPAADDCRAELARDQVELHRAAEDLRWRAYQLDREAEQLDVLEVLEALRMAPMVGG